MFIDEEEMNEDKYEGNSNENNIDNNIGAGNNSEDNDDNNSEDNDDNDEKTIMMRKIQAR